MSDPTKEPPFDVVAIDNHDVVRAGLVSLQITHPNIVRTLRTYPTVPDLNTVGPPPDVVVLDYWLGRDDSPSTHHITQIKTWNAPVLLYTSEERPVLLREALYAGVQGLCLKNDGMTALAEAIRTVGQGHLVFSGPLARAALNDDSIGATLTTRETEVLRALALGLTPEEIALSQHVERSTIRSQIESVRSKYADHLGARVNSARMVHEASRDGYVEPARRRTPKAP